MTTTPSKKPDKIQLRGAHSNEWSAKNPILKEREPGLEEDTGRVKYGDGVTRWNDLDYPEYMTATGGNGPGGVSQEEFDDHVNSVNPHPEYDSGADFLVYYQNAKV